MLRKIEESGSPFILDRFDDEAKRWAHFVDIFFHDLLDNRGLASIVEPPSQNIEIALFVGVDYDLQHQDPHLLVLQTGLSQDRQHFEDFSCVVKRG